MNFKSDILNLALPVYLSFTFLTCKIWIVSTYRIFWKLNGMIDVKHVVEFLAHNKHPQMAAVIA